MKTTAIALLAFSLLSFAAQSAERRVIEISERNPRYFETADGKPWIPIGFNLCFDREYESRPAEERDAKARQQFDRWLRTFAANGGNCIRLWAGHRSLEVMPERDGVYDPGRTETMKFILALCEELDIKVKVTLESFRFCMSEAEERAKPNPKGINFSYYHAFNRPLYAAYAKDLREFFESEKCRAIYLGKARYLKDLGFGDSPAVYCWELWNEINCCAPIGDYAKWSAWALPELKRLFPRQMTVNNLGSFSDVAAYQMYDELAEEKDNDFMQIHRYLDSGACIDDCRGPMDIVAASAVRELLNRRPDRPAVVAEIGAVQANHAGPFPYYPFDKKGTLLHDALFAAFFAGSAGCGQFWHWDSYVDRHDLWWHFKRFATAIEGLDPVAEGFRPFYTESRRLRMYGLKGRKTAVFWCRDKRSSWEDEFVHGNKPDLLDRERMPFGDCNLDCYLPWEDRRVTVKAPTLPPFKRSIVVRVPADAVEGIVRAH